MHRGYYMLCAWGYSNLCGGGGYGWRPKQLTCEVPKSAPERRVGRDLEAGAGIEEKRR